MKFIESEIDPRQSRRSITSIFPESMETQYPNLLASLNLLEIQI